MKILLTNDDSIQCQGIWVLKEHLEKLDHHEIYTIAPEENQSGISHGITMRGPIRLQQKGDRLWTCSGTPADCVIIGLLGDLEIQPDMVISGINEGPNIGTDIVYSGTAAAARQGALHGIPSIAVSMGSHTKPFHYETAAQFINQNLDTLLSLWEKDTFLNINVPNSLGSNLSYTLTYPAKRQYNDNIVQFAAPDGHHYCFFDSGNVNTKLEEGSDWHTVEQGRVSISKIYIHPVVIQDLKPRY